MFDPEELRTRLQPFLVDPARLDVPAGVRLAAVLIPVLTAAPEPRVIFTKRADTLSRHPGEISFPGGLADEGEGLAAAVLREAEEELGLVAGDVELVGALPPVHTRVSGILIVPFVGLLSLDPRLTPNAAEIADVLEFPLERLIRAGAEREFEHDGYRFRTQVYEMDGHTIWGATGWILGSFISAVAAAPAAREG